MRHISCARITEHDINIYFLDSRQEAPARTYDVYRVLVTLWYRYREQLYGLNLDNDFHTFSNGKGGKKT